MTFDVSQLPGRAQELKKAGISMLTAMFESGDLTGTAYGTSQKLAEQSMAGVEHIYDDWLDIPSPDTFSPTTHMLLAAQSHLAVQGYSRDPSSKSPSTPDYGNPDFGRIATTSSYLQPWTGEAASAYQDTFAGRFTGTLSNEYVATEMLRGAIEAEAGVWYTARDQLDNLSQDAIDKVNECMHKSPSDWKLSLAIAAGVVSVAGGLVGAAISGGSTIPVAFTALSSTISAVNTAAGASGGDKDTKGLATGNPIKIVESLRSALTELNKQITEGEKLIHDGMTANAGKMQAQWKDLVLPRPALADAPDHAPDDPRYAGVDA